MSTLLEDLGIICVEMRDDYQLFSGLTQESDTMSEDKKKNFRHSYTEYETLEEAERHAQRDTARELRSQNVWQRIRETVVPDVDIVIKPVDVVIEAVK